MRRWPERPRGRRAPCERCHAARYEPGRVHGPQRPARDRQPMDRRWRAPRRPRPGRGERRATRTVPVHPELVASLTKSPSSTSPSRPTSASAGWRARCPDGSGTRPEGRFSGPTSTSRRPVSACTAAATPASPRGSTGAYPRLRSPSGPGGQTPVEARFQPGLPGLPRLSVYRARLGTAKVGHGLTGRNGVPRQTGSGAPGRTRTCGQALRRRLLYPLSYGGLVWWPRSWCPGVG